MDGATLDHSKSFAREAARRWDELKAFRVSYERDWEDIARLIRPQRGGFSMDNYQQREMQKPLSSEPIMASTAMASGLYAAITNPANRWAGLETPDSDLNKWKPMAEWIDVATRRVMRSFNPSSSSFYSATFQGYSDIAAFGQFAGYDEVDLKERRFVDVTLSLAEVVVDIDAHNRVCEVVRKYRMKPRAAMRHFRQSGDQIPPKLREMAEKGSNEDVVFYHHVFLNDGYSVSALGPKGKPWLSIHATEIEEATIRVAGFYEMPFYFPRWDVDGGQIYAIGPGFMALPSARVNHQMDAATVRAAQKASDPTLLAPDRRAMPLEGKVRPGEVLYGGMSVKGTPLVTALNNVGQIGLTIEEKRDKIEAMKNAFYYSLMSLHNRTGIGPEEVEIVREAQLRNWAPHSDRIMEEYAARKVERRFRMLWRAGQLPPPPKEAEGMPLQVRYQSAATMALRAREAGAVRQFLNDLGAMAQFESVPTRVGDRFDVDAAVEVLHDASPNLPASLLRSREDADARGQQREAAQQQAMQMEQMAQAAQAGGGLVKDLAQAQGAGGFE